MTDPEELEERAVFVPAIMSVGLLASLATLVRDAVRWMGGQARHRRRAIEARSTFSDLIAEEEPPAEELGYLSRAAYLVSAGVLFAGAAYVGIGSAINYAEEGGPVSDVGWVLAVTLALTCLLAFFGVVAFAVFLSWPTPPSWALTPLRYAPLTTTPGREDIVPPWRLTAWMIGSGIFTGAIALLVASGSGVVDRIDEPIHDWFVDVEFFGRLEAIDPFGSTIFSMGLVTLIALSIFRCRVMAIVYPVAFAVSWNTTMFLRDVIDRTRPTGLGLPTSFPSGHMVQAVFIAGLLPLALGLLLSDRRVVVVTRAVLAMAVLATAAHRIHRQDHWPLDALGGVALGSTVVLGVHWVLAHRRWHSHCSHCPWSAHPETIPWRHGVFTLSPRVARITGFVGVAVAIGAAVALLLATFVMGLPADPEGEGLASAIIAPMQVGFAVLIALAGLLALRWKATAAGLMALGATMLGLIASVQYAPYLAFGLAALLMIPAVLTWFAWQPNETIGSIARLAVITISLLTLTGFGSREIYGYYFGPTHADSAMVALDSDATWLWLGAVDTDSATIVAGGLDPDSIAAVTYWPSDEDMSVAVTRTDEVDAYGVARFDIESLQGAQTYSYLVRDSLNDAIEPDDEAAAVPFRTHGEGAQDLTVVLGSCARRGSNGAVFDAILSEEPDLYLALGDLHYGNISSDDPADHIREYGVSLRQPGQSALFRSVPTAYVWDDHDYGPNDADASSPARDAVSAAYRSAVPHAGVSADIEDSIGHAFTVGRVRFVMTDTRSHRTDASMLGVEQLDWFIEELTSASRSHALVVWANPTPWVAAAGSGADDWSAHADERRLISDAIAAAGIENLVMVSGDAHMLAIDDGSNTGYSTDGTGGFPLLHAAALDRPGSEKGGPYSEGAFPGAGQYGRLEVRDDGGSTIELTLSGHNWQDEEIVSWSKVISVGEAA